jgi:WD repeat-containing protein 35
LRLAQKESHQRIETLLDKYGAQLVASGRIGQATELYRKAEKYTESARLLIQLGRQVVADGGPPIRAKELFVLGALDVEHFKRQKLSSTRTSKGEDALEGLFEVESKTATDRFLQDPWHGAEAIHFLILAQNQLFANDIEAAFGTAMLLSNYDDIIEMRVLYSIIALTSYFAAHFKVCSRAFIHLESLEDRELASVFESLAVDLFVKHRPEDPPGGLVKCVQCGEALESWCTTCSKCHAKYPPCVSTGRVLFQGPTWTCKVCRHHASVIGMESRKCCPLCHSSVE